MPRMPPPTLLPVGGDTDVSEDHLCDVAVVGVGEPPRAPIHLHAHVPPSLALGRALRTPARARRVRVGLGRRRGGARRSNRPRFLPPHV